MSDVQVVVVGGGPAGAATAARLAGVGVDVLVLDRARFPREKACAEFLSPGTVDALDRLGLRDEAAAAGAWQHGMRIVSERATLTLDYADGHRGLGVARTKLDTLVLGAARSAGARVDEGVAVLGAIQEKSRVRGVRVRDADGRVSTVTAELVVAADGVHSPVARSLGLERPAPWPRRVGLVAHVDGVEPDALGLMAVGSGRYCGVAAVGAGELSVGMALSDGLRRPSESVTALWERVVDSLPSVREALAGSTRTSRIRGVAPLARAVRRVSGPGYLLVGDAAGFVDPFTGEGVHRALRGAELAADSTLEALRRSDRHALHYPAARRSAFAAKHRAYLGLQAVLAVPAFLEYCLRRAAGRRHVAAALAGVFGDYLAPATLYHPRTLLELIRP